MKIGLCNEFTPGVIQEDLKPQIEELGFFFESAFFDQAEIR
ncbi:hypothetical protein P9314_14520 [Paenibacillus validus]|nr:MULTISPECIES: hypothetical protein [Paenibacillus]MED4601911.1 hypothetical protein [Paenibacillus validus]MED4606966.1 hypothetical protein [Paenibacillus validus]